MSQCVIKKVKTTETRQGYGGGDEVVTAFIPFYEDSSTRLASVTILYSHIVGDDLGFTLPWCRKISKLLRVNVCTYDYNGYGQSSGGGRPSFFNAEADITAVFNYLKEEWGIPPKQIILFGNAVGGGPTVIYKRSFLNSSVSLSS